MASPTLRETIDQPVHMIGAEPSVTEFGSRIKITGFGDR
jgi:hypothetical protein